MTSPSPARPRRVLVAGPPGLTRDLVHTLLRGRGVAVDAAADDRPDVAVLVDPQPDDWLAGSQRPTVVVRRQRPADDVALVLRGADAVVALDDATTEQVWEAVEAVAGGKTLLDPTSCRRLAEVARTLHREHLAAQLGLTVRELEVLRAIEQGESVKQIAQALSLSVKTIEGVHTRLFRKLGVRNRAQAVRRALEAGLSATSTDDDPVG